MSWQALEKSEHQMRVEEFMRKAGQELPDRPTIPIDEVLIRRARLTLEEALEKISALGVTVVTKDNGDELNSQYIEDEGLNYADGFYFNLERTPNLVKIVDGCLDCRVIATGTLLACGVADEALQREVDYNNLAKFGEGGHRDEHGKWIKPPGHKPPDIERILDMQTEIIKARKGQ